MISKVCAIFFAMLLLVAFSFSCFADSINQTEQFAFIARTPVTAMNFSNDTFPITDVTTCVKGVSYGTLQLALYSAGWQEGNSGTPAIVDINITSGVSSSATVPVQHIAPSTYNYGWHPTMWEDAPWWRLYGSNQNLWAEFNPTDYASISSSINYWYKCYTSAPASYVNFENGTTIKSVSLAYHAPNWYNTTGDLAQIGPITLNGNDPAYFDGMKNLGYYTLVFSCTNPRLEQFTITLEYLAYAGEYDFTTSSYLVNSSNTGTNNAVHYDAGYQSGFQDGVNSARPQIDSAYENGFIAGVNAGGEGYSFFTSALLAIGEIPFNMMFQIADLEILGFNFGALVTMSLMGLVLVWCIRKLFL